MLFKYNALGVGCLRSVKKNCFLYRWTIPCSFPEFVVKFWPENSLPPSLTLTSLSPSHPISPPCASLIHTLTPPPRAALSQAPPPVPYSPTPPHPLRHYLTCTLSFTPPFCTISRVLSPLPSCHTISHTMKMYLNISLNFSLMLRISKHNCLDDKQMTVQA